MNARVRRNPALAAAGLFAAAVIGWLAFGSVRIGVGWSSGESRPARAVIRLANEAMAATGIAPGWRWLAWGGAAVALVGGLLLVWLALAAFLDPDSPEDAAGRPDR